MLSQIPNKSGYPIISESNYCVFTLVYFSSLAHCLHQRGTQNESKVQSDITVRLPVEISDLSYDKLGFMRLFAYLIVLPFKRIIQFSRYKGWGGCNQGKRMSS